MTKLYSESYAKYKEKFRSVIIFLYKKCSIFFLKNLNEAKNKKACSCGFHDDNHASTLYCIQHKKYLASTINRNSIILYIFIAFLLYQINFRLKNNVQPLLLAVSYHSSVLLLHVAHNEYLQHALMSSLYHP